jgi:ATP-dependent RNA helicase DHX37/DHR1
MVNRLRRTFITNAKHSQMLHDTISKENRFQDDVDMKSNDIALSLRDLDDDEEDDEIFRSDPSNDTLDSTALNVEIRDENKEIHQDTKTADEDKSDDGIPKKAIILPLYSLLSPLEQAKVFDSVPEGHRLIVVATNIAETSITIPDIKYVVDSGRQKCRHYNSSTGVASYEIVWISKAAADQRAGRAGRTGPGHCYRLYSSSMYARHMDPFASPEVLTRPLEDVILAMKAMKISNISNFPFPTPPDKRQIDAALNLLANIGCVDLTNAEKNQDDGSITRLGSAIVQLPLGVRCGKILLVAAQAGVLDYAIVIVAAMSEQSPFLRTGHIQLENKDDDDTETNLSSDESETETTTKNDHQKSKFRWTHKCGDFLATLHAVGAYTYAGCNVSNVNEQKKAYRVFCEQNDLNPAIMERIQKLRTHLCRLAKARLSYATGIAAANGGFVQSMKPPNKVQERLLCQAIASGLLDHVALLAPLGSISGEHPYSIRSAYLSCCASTNAEPLFMDRNSCIYSHDTRILPKWICYESTVRKTLKDGTPIVVMKNITPIESIWLGSIAKNSRLLSTGDPIPSPIPIYDNEQDAIMCSVTTRFGHHGYEIPSIRINMYDALQTPQGKKNTHFMSDDSYRWFARYLLEGKVINEMKQFETMYNDSTSLITRSCPMKKVSMLVSTLANAGIDNVQSLKKQWSKQPKFMGDIILQHWIKPEKKGEYKTLWMKMIQHVVSTNITTSEHTA